MTLRGLHTGLLQALSSAVRVLFGAWDRLLLLPKTKLQSWHAIDARLVIFPGRWEQTGVEYLHQWMRRAVSVRGQSQSDS